MKRQNLEKSGPKYKEPALTTQTLHPLSIIRHVLSAKLLTRAEKKNVKPVFYHRQSAKTDGRSST